MKLFFSVMAVSIIASFSTAHSARAGRYLEPAVDLFDNGTGLYNMDGERLSGIKAPGRELLVRLKNMNEDIVGLRNKMDEKFRAYQRHPTNGGKKIHFSELTKEEFMDWQKKLDPKFVKKSFTDELFEETKAKMAKEEARLQERLAAAEAKKAATFAANADRLAWDLGEMAHKFFVMQGWDSADVDTNKMFRLVGNREEKFLSSKLSAKPKIARGRGKAGLVGAAIVGASIGYEMITSEGAEASELKEADIHEQKDSEVNERSDVGISELDAE